MARDVSRAAMRAALRDCLRTFRGAMVPEPEVRGLTVLVEQEPAEPGWHKRATMARRVARVAAIAAWMGVLVLVVATALRMRSASSPYRSMDWHAGGGANARSKNMDALRLYRVWVRVPVMVVAPHSEEALLTARELVPEDIRHYVGRAEYEAAQVTDLADLGPLGDDVPLLGLGVDAPIRTAREWLQYLATAEDGTE